MQIVIGIGAKPAIGPFEKVGLDTTVGGIQVSVLIHLCNSVTMI